MVRFTHRGLVLLGLSSLAFAQPVLSDMTVGFFVAHRSQPIDLVVLAVGLVVVPWLVLMAVEEIVARLYRRALIPLHLTFVLLLSGIAVTQLLTSPQGWTSRMALGLATGVALAVAYARFSVIRSFAAALAVAPVLSLGSFLLLGATADIVFPKSVSEAQAQTSTDRSRTPVVLVIFDELPATTITGPDGRIERRLFPNFARLASHANWYPNATSVHNKTRYALPAILTGKVSSGSSQPTAADHPNSIFRLLGSGHDQTVSEPYTQVCPRSICKDSERSALSRISDLMDNVLRLAARRYLPGQIAESFPPIEQWRDSDPGRQVRRFESSLRPGRRPGLHVLHMVLPHAPWRYLPDGRRYGIEFEPEAGIARNRLSTDPWPVAQRYQRHVLQTQFADRLLGRLIDRMQASGLWDEALVVAVADHGLAIRPGQSNRDFPDGENYQDVISVPLLIKRPGQHRPRASSRFVRTIDVVPSIADVLGLRLPWKVDGTSAFSKPSRDDLTLHMDPKPSIVVSPEEFRERKDQIVEPRRMLLAAEREGLDAFAMGPFPELIGTDLEGRRLLTGTGSVKLEGPHELPALDGAAEVLPARLAGRATGLPTGQAVAVAVDGRVVATSRTYASSHGGTSFTAMLPPDVFEHGGDVAVLSVSGQGKHRRITRLRLES
jgi:hypothetical protein